MIESRATKEQRQMVVGGEVIEKMPINRLIEWRNIYRALYQRELEEADQAAGLGNPNDIYVRFEPA